MSDRSEMKFPRHIEHGLINRLLYIEKIFFKICTAAGADRSAGAESDGMSQSCDRVHDMLGAVSSHSRVTYSMTDSSRVRNYYKFTTD